MNAQDQPYKKKRRTVHSISFNDDDLKIIKLAAQQEGLSFASFLKNATLEYIKESLEYQRLVDSGAIKEQQKDKAIPDAMGTFENTVKNTLLSIHEQTKAKLRRIEWLVENNLYYQFYYNRMVPDEELENTIKLATYRMKKTMERLKAEIGKEEDKRIVNEEGTNL